MGMIVGQGRVGEHGFRELQANGGKWEWMWHYEEVGGKGG